MSFLTHVLLFYLWNTGDISDVFPLILLSSSELFTKESDHWVVIELKNQISAFYE